METLRILFYTSQEAPVTYKASRLAEMNYCFAVRSRAAIARMRNLIKKGE